VSSSNSSTGNGSAAIRDEDARGPEARSRQPSTGVVAADLDADVSERVRDPAWQLSELACYLVNLAIPVPSRSRRRVFSRRDDQERTVDDDEIPFCRDEPRSKATMPQSGERVSQSADCDRTVIRAPQNLNPYGGLSTHTE
jgi:hypothetical protein